MYSYRDGQRAGENLYDDRGAGRFRYLYYLDHDDSFVLRRLP
jgi:hypothetical protein